MAWRLVQAVLQRVGDWTHHRFYLRLHAKMEKRRRARERG
jgi:hypothetical protein